MNTILLIEDNVEIRENTAEILELANYKVVTAENGKDGVEKAAAVKPDVIICDIMMPVLDGYGVLHMLNKNEQLRDIPFVFLTAKAEHLSFYVHFQAMDCRQQNLYSIAPKAKQQHVEYSYYRLCIRIVHHLVI